MMNSFPRFAKMTKPLVLIGLTLLLSLTFLTPAQVGAQTAPDWTHFRGANVSMGYLTPRTAVKDNTGRDLIDMAHAIGLNILRISTSSNLDPVTKLSIYSKEDWDSVLGKLASYDMKAIIMIHNDVYNSIGEFNEQYIPFVTDLMITKGLATNPAVFAVDLANEPLITPHNLLQLRAAKALVKKANPDLLTTIGGWRVEQTVSCPPLYGNGTWCWNDPANANAVTEFSDYYSAHHYLYDKYKGHVECTPGTIGDALNTDDSQFPEPVEHTRSFIAAIRADVDNDKPIVLEEYGASNGQICNDQKTLISPDQQAQIYHGVLKAFNQYSTALNFIGVINWSLFEPCDKKSGWGIIIKLSVKGPEDCAGGSFKLLPAAKIIQQYAAGTQAVNEVQNASFESDARQWLAPWNFQVRTGAAAEIIQDDSTHTDGAYSAKITVTTASTDWYAQLKQSYITFDAHEKQIITFWARASTKRNMRVIVQQGYAPYSSYFQQTVMLSNAWKQYTLSFTPDVAEVTALLAFNVANEVGDVWIDNVMMQ